MLRESLVKYLHHVLLQVNQSKGTLQQLKPHKFLQHYHPNFSYNLTLMIKSSKSTLRFGDMPLFKINNAPHLLPCLGNQIAPEAIIVEEYFPRFINQLLQLPWTAIARWVTLAYARHQHSLLPPRSIPLSSFTISSIRLTKLIRCWRIIDKIQL